MYLSLPCFVLDDDGDGDMIGGRRGRSPRFSRGKRNLLFNHLHPYNQLVFFSLPLDLPERLLYNLRNILIHIAWQYHYLKFSLNHKSKTWKVCLNINKSVTKSKILRVHVLFKYDATHIYTRFLFSYFPIITISLAEKCWFFFTLTKLYCRSRSF